MGNHELECEYCGADHRITPNCCGARKMRDDALKKARREEEAYQARFLSKYGLVPELDEAGRPTQLNVRDVLRAIKRLERRTDARYGVTPLKPGDVVVFRERCVSAAGDVREPGQCARVRDVFVGSSFDLVDVEWGPHGGPRIKPEAGMLDHVDSRILDLFY